MEFQDWIDRFFDNMGRYLSHEIPSSVFSYTADYQSSGYILGGIVLSIIVLIGFIKLKEYRWAVGAYLLATFGILFLWPEIWNGIRFILAIVPLLTFLFAYGIVAIIELLLTKAKAKNPEKTIQRISFGFVLLILIFFGKLEDLNKEASKKYDPLYTNYFALAKWSKQNLNDSAVVICRKPNLFYLEAQKFVNGFSKMEGIPEFLHTLDLKQTTHVVVYGDGITQRYFMPAYQKNQEKFKVIYQFQNPDMWLLEYHPDLGYSGDWQGDKKEGSGTYIFADGRKYVGEWKNDQMHGPGKMYSPEGKLLVEGSWENGQLKTQNIVE